MRAATFGLESGELGGYILINAHYSSSLKEAEEGFASTDLRALGECLSGKARVRLSEAFPCLGVLSSRAPGLGKRHGRQNEPNLGSLQ